MKRNVYVLSRINNDKKEYLYRTYNNKYLFQNTPNVFFNTEEGANNFIQYNSHLFDDNNVEVTLWE